MIFPSCSAGISVARRHAVLAGSVSILTLLGVMGNASAQSATQLGPTQIVGTNTGLATGLSTPWVAAGAVGPLAVNPANPSTLYIGAVNGGVWKSTDSGAHWQVLTPHQSSPSIGALAIDPTAPDTVIAGFGNFSSASSRGGYRGGLIRSTNGGRSWTPIGGATLDGQQIDGIAVSDSDILAAATRTRRSPSSGGLFWSGNGGVGFTKVLSGSVTSLVSDPKNPARVYAAVVKGSSSAVYQTSNGGRNWKKVFDGASVPGAPIGNNTERMVVATGPGGAVAVAVLNKVPKSTDPTHFQWAGIAPRAIYFSRDSGHHWVKLRMPQESATGRDGTHVTFGLDPIGQGMTHFSLAIDPRNPSLIYVGGSAQLVPGLLPASQSSGDTSEPDAVSSGSTANSIGAEGPTATVFRINVRQNGTSVATPVTNDFAKNNGAPHSDTRAMAFSEGRLLLSSDGGVYMLNHPETNDGTWSGLNDGLSLLEVYQAVRDPVTGGIFAAAQDNGVVVGLPSNSGRFESAQGGDGFNAAVNSRSLASKGESVVYLGSNELRVSRFISNTRGPKHVSTVYFLHNGYQLPAKGNKYGLGAMMSLNNVDPARIALNTSGVFIGTDTFGASSYGADKIDVQQLLPASNSRIPTALDFGTRDNPSALLAGFNALPGVPDLYLSTAEKPGPGTLQPVSGWSVNLRSPMDVLFDPASQDQFYVVNSTPNVYATTNTGKTFVNLRGNLPSSFYKIDSLGYISADGVNALLVGGVSKRAGTPSNVYAAPASDLKDWRPFANGLPNVIVDSLSYDKKGNDLVIGTLGRGVWTVYDATTWFPTATVLRFGAANNNSRPVAQQLTNGVAADGKAFSRGLLKLGSGTLTLNGSLGTYTGPTTVKGGAILASGGDPLGRSSNLVLDGGALITSGESTVLNVPLSVGSHGGILSQWTPGTLFLYGAVSGPGTLTLTSNPWGTIVDDDPPAGPPLGGTVLRSGGFVVGDAMHRQTVLNSSVDLLGGVLAGDGTINGNVVNQYGTVSPGAPGAPGGVLTVAGNYRQSASGTLRISIAPHGSAGDSRLQVQGHADLGGTVEIAMAPKGYRFGARYALLHAAGGVSSSFDASIATNPYFKPVARYGSQTVMVSLDPSNVLFGTGKGVIGSAFVRNQSLMDAFGAIVGGALQVPGVGQQDRHGGSGIWMHALGGFGEAGQGAISQYGGVVGDGVRIARNWVAGMALSGLGTRTSDVNDRVTGQSAGAYAYGIRTQGRLRLSGAIGAGGSSLESTRSMPLIGRSARGSTSGWFAGLSLAARFQIRLAHSGFLVPFAEASYLHTTTAAFSGSGAGMFNIAYGSVPTNAGMLAAGVQLGRTFHLAGAALTPWAMLGTSGTIGQPYVGTTENIDGFAHEQTALALPGVAFDAGAGIEVADLAHWHLGATWTGTYAHRSHANNFEIRARYHW